MAKGIGLRVNREEICGPWSCETVAERGASARLLRPRVSVAPYANTIKNKSANKFKDVDTPTTISIILIT